ncbi:MAG: hypothetical protein AAF942_07230 [Pseudomonadota bacterium]
MGDTQQQSLDILRDGLMEAQATVRAYDTKAQIVGVGYIFALGIVGQVGEQLPATPEADLPMFLVAWGIVIMPILLFGFVLYPTRKVAPKLAKKPERKLHYVLYVEAAQERSVATLREAAEQCDPVDEMAFELLKVSGLRELKRQRFLRALFAAGICFFILFLIQFTTTIR